LKLPAFLQKTVAQLQTGFAERFSTPAKNRSFASPDHSMPWLRPAPFSSTVHN
jgi:hypothetical protein